MTINIITQPEDRKTLTSIDRILMPRYSTSPQSHKLRVISMYSSAGDGKPAETAVPASGSSSWVEKSGM